MRLHLALPATRGHRRLVSALVIDALGTGMFLPFSILYFVETSHLSLAEVGLAVSLASGLRLPLAAPLGSLTDRWGPRRVLVAANVVQGLGFLAYLAVDPFWSLVAAAFVVQLGNSAFWASYAPLITQVSGPGQRERWFGFVGAARNAGFGVGGLLAGTVVAAGGGRGYQVVVLVNALSFAVAAVLLVLDRTGRAPAGVTSGGRTRGAWRVVLGDRAFLGLTLSNAAFATCTLALNVVIPVYAVRQLGLPGWVPGAALTVNCVLVAAGQSALVAAMTGHRRVRVLQAGAASFALSSLVLWWAAVLPASLAGPVVVAGVVVFTLGELAHSPVSSAVSGEAAPEHLRGRYLSVFQASWTLSSTVGPALLLPLLARGDGTVWLVLALTAGAAAAGTTTVARALPAARTRIGHVEPVDVAPVEPVAAA